MGELRSADGKYLCADQGDGNFVVYLAESMRPLWDRWSFEAAEGWQVPTRPSVPPTPPSGPSASRLIQVTDASDGDFVNRIYSYWPNAFVRGDDAFVFAGHVDDHPRFFRVSLSTGSVDRLGPAVSYGGTTEGWYWDREGWIYLCDGPLLRRVNPFSGEDRIVVDISDSFPGCRLWQAHSSDDGTIHSATVDRIVSDGPYPHLGTAVFRLGQVDYFPAQGTLDESQITPDGEYVVIKEDDRNRIIHLDSRITATLRQEDGAVGHSDCGVDFLVGEDDAHGECVLWDLRLALTPSHRRTLFHTWNMGHVSVRENRCLLSDREHLSLVGLDGSGVTPLIAHGIVGDGYDYQVRANLDPSGRVACFLSNREGRMDVYLYVI